MSPFPQTIETLTNVVIQRSGRVAPLLSRRTLLTSTVALLFALLAGCGAPRPSKYSHLTTPGDTAADPPASSVYPVTILVGPLSASHLYREDHIVYSSSGPTRMVT